MLELRCGVNAALDAKLLQIIASSFKELFLLQFFPLAEQERLNREYHSQPPKGLLKKSTEYKRVSSALAGFLGQAACTLQNNMHKNFRWGLHNSNLDHVMCIPFNGSPKQSRVPTEGYTSPYLQHNVDKTPKKCPPAPVLLLQMWPGWSSSAEDYAKEHCCSVS
ncbi:hypothetical protein Tco_0252612 [Tanacetum coccineum]